MKRVVLDTNVLVSGAYDDFSASWRIVEACARGDLTAVVSPALRVEYERILRDAVRIRGFETQVQSFLSAAETVTPFAVPRVVPDDPEDDKIVATAVAGETDAIITNDRHLLDLDPYLAGERTIRVLRPDAFERMRTDEYGSRWQDFTRLLGITP